MARLTMYVCDLCGAKSDSPLPGTVKLTAGRGPGKQLAELCGDCVQAELVIRRAPKRRTSDEPMVEEPVAEPEPEPVAV